MEGGGSSPLAPCVLQWEHRFMPSANTNFDDRRGLDEQMAELAQTLDSLRSLDAALDAVTLSALTAVEGAEFANITVRRPNEPVGVVSATSPSARRVSELQRDLDQGPCIEAAQAELLVVSDDVASDSRWPTWGPMVRETVGSALSAQLVSARGVHGSINLFSSQTRAFTSDSVMAVTVLAIHAAVAMRSAILENDLKSVADSRLLIGQAEGILMTKFGLDEEGAFAVLRRLSNSQNVKILEIARRLVETRGADLDGS